MAAGIKKWVQNKKEGWEKAKKGDVWGGIARASGGTGVSGGFEHGFGGGDGGFGGSKIKVDPVAGPNADNFTQSARQQELANMLAQQYGMVQNRQAPTLGDASTINAAVIDQAKQAEFRNQQMALAQALQAQSMGQGPSLANQQLRMGTDRNIAQAMAMAGSMRGGNAAAGLRNVQNQTSMLNQQAAQQAALQRMQEQMSAREQLAGVLASGRNMDIGLATNQAGLDQQANMSNQQALNAFMVQRQNAALQQQGMNDGMAKFYADGMVNSANQERGYLQEYDKLRLAHALDERRLQMGADQANAAARQGFFSTVGGMITGMGGGGGGGMKMGQSQSGGGWTGGNGSGSGNLA